MLNPIRIGELSLKRLLRFILKLIWRLLRWLWRRKVGVLLTGIPLLLSALVVGFYVTPCCGGDSNLEEARFQIGHIKQSLDVYYTRTDPHVYPDKLEQLVEMNIMAEMPADPWGNPYVYIRAGDTEYGLLSAGPDKIAGTDDDIIAGREY